MKIDFCGRYSRLLVYTLRMSQSLVLYLYIETPIGTNLGLLRVLWALVSGQLLTTRGALIPALANIGLSDTEVSFQLSR